MNVPFETSCSIGKQQLSKNPFSSGYIPCKYYTGLWRHTMKKIMFCLCVDNFCVKYFLDADSDHLLKTLKKHYRIYMELEGNNSCGLTINWN